MTAIPKHATPRNPSRRSDGPRIARVAAALGVPLMPWQQQVMDVATERDDNGSLVYELVFVTVPRQSGKSTLIWTLVVDRLLTMHRQNIFYTAQTQQDARRRFGDLEKLAAESPFADVLKFRRSMSDTGATSLLTGTRSSTFAPGFKVLHGETPPLVILDEVFAHSLELGDAMLEGAIIPAQQTLAGNRQIWLVSTAGTAESGFMRKWLDIGREGRRPKMAFFEWSLHDGDDPYSPESLERFHPAVGHLVTAQDLLDSRPPSKAQWLRGYCNLWLEAATPLIDLDDWDTLPGNTTPPPRADLTVAFEAELDSASSSVVAAWHGATGAPNIRVLHTAPGTAWLAPFLRKLRDDWHVKTIAADNGGTTRRIADQLENDGFELHRLTATEFASGTGELIDAVRAGELHHDASISLRRGIAGAQLQHTGDTSRISRTRSTGHTAALIAAIVALRAATYAPALPAKPLVTF